jgi:hypothetical protein
MLREHVFNKRAAADPLFRWRGSAVSRLEGLSDGVFAVTLTLLVVSGGVPATFPELWDVIRDLPIFLASFALLLMAWQYHYMFFRRYGLEDGWTAMLNAVFLFLVLFYAYPLKFLATFLWRLVLGDDTNEMFRGATGAAWRLSELDPRSWMMIFYGVGIVGVFGVLALMVLHAYRERHQLELDEIEIVLTMGSLRAHLLTVAVAVLSLLIVGLGFQAGWAGIVYFLMAPLQTINGVYAGRRAERLRAAADGNASFTDQSDASSSS